MNTNIRHIIQRVRTDPNPTRLIAARILQYTHACNFFTIHRNNYSLRFHPNNFSADLWYNPNQPRSDEDFITAYLRNGETYIDVGSNIGTTTIAGAAAVGPEGIVISIEPHPRTCNYLQANLTQNNLNHVTIIQKALGEQCKTAALTNKFHQDDVNAISTTNHGISVAMTTLDSLDLGLTCIHLLKVDVEGYELSVFRGAENTLKSVECILFESYETQYNTFGHSLNNIITYLSKHGFTVLRQGVNNHWVTLSDTYTSKDCENLVAAKNLTDFYNRITKTQKIHLLIAAEE